MCNNVVIYNMSSLDEGTLTRTYDIEKMSFEAVSNDFRYYFINYITKTNLV